ncbi:glycosyltransferase family 2 protein [Desulfurococcus mucosus]|uniref:Glycosyl transferase family 2 n=1 Tax=Desulfurococcus mucosus (strain ATCC 35584 / DSM 2162 / JCM 9187 / O7/1) TaxID=765177 RepID=E8R8A7_DESM0|nr:glycosyltransferase family 2 protein [Desulfurococcus mucosus]ADV64733.1 glycosyl transferase family 2 [Desulfurococcus mucosus DSM 2162]
MGSVDYSDLTVVIPVFNEAEAIGLVLDEVLAAGVPRERILVVDGGSTDGTVEAASSRGVRVVQQEGRGKADAVKTAARLVETGFTLIMDGDYTYPAGFIQALYVKAREGYDLVVGWRRWGEGSQPLVYRLGNKLLTFVFNTLFATRLHDVLSGMYIVKTSVLREVPFEMKGFSVESEIAAYAAGTGARVAEVPVEYRRRLGRKKLGVRHGLRILLDVVRLTWRYSPAFFIFTLGSLLLIPGLALGSWVAYHYFFTGTVYHVKGLTAVILTAAGLQSLLLAVIALYMKRMELRILSTLKHIDQH